MLHTAFVCLTRTCLLASAAFLFGPTSAYGQECEQSVSIEALIGGKGVSNPGFYCGTGCNAKRYSTASGFFVRCYSEFWAPYGDCGTAYNWQNYSRHASAETVKLVADCGEPFTLIGGDVVEEYSYYSTTPTYISPEEDTCGPPRVGSGRLVMKNHSEIVEALPEVGFWTADIMASFRCEWWSDEDPSWTLVQDVFVPYCEGLGFTRKVWEYNEVYGRGNRVYEHSTGAGHGAEITPKRLAGIATACAMKTVSEASFSNPEHVSPNAVASFELDEEAGVTLSLSKWRIKCTGLQAKKHYEITLKWGLRKRAGVDAQENTIEWIEKKSAGRAPSSGILFYPSQAGQFLLPVTGSTCGQLYEKRLLEASVSSVSKRKPILH